MKVKGVGRGPGVGFFGPLALGPGAVPSPWFVLGDLLDVSLRPRVRQGWAGITSSQARSGTSQTALVSDELSSKCSPSPQRPFPSSSFKPALEKVLSLAPPEPSEVPGT